MRGPAGSSGVFRETERAAVRGHALRDGRSLRLYEEELNTYSDRTAFVELASAVAHRADVPSQRRKVPTKFRGRSRRRKQVPKKIVSGLDRQKKLK